MKAQTGWMVAFAVVALGAVAAVTPEAFDALAARVDKHDERMATLEAEVAVLRTQIQIASAGAGDIPAPPLPDNAAMRRAAWNAACQRAKKEYNRSWALADVPVSPKMTRRTVAGYFCAVPLKSRPVTAGGRAIANWENRHAVAIVPVAHGEAGMVAGVPELREIALP